MSGPGRTDWDESFPGWATDDIHVNAATAVYLRAGAMESVAVPPLLLEFPIKPLRISKRPPTRVHSPFLEMLTARGWSQCWELFDSDAPFSSDIRVTVRGFRPDVLAVEDDVDELFRGSVSAVPITGSSCAG